MCAQLAQCRRFWSRVGFPCCRHIVRGDPPLHLRRGSAGSVPASYGCVRRRLCKRDAGWWSTVSWTTRGTGGQWHTPFVRSLGAQCVWWRHRFWSPVSTCGNAPEDSGGAAINGMQRRLATATQLLPRKGEFDWESDDPCRQPRAGYKS